jgi:hypothetical protein
MLFFKAIVPENCSGQHAKAAAQSYCPKAAILQTYSLKRLPKSILQSGSRKLLPKVATESLKSAPRSGLYTGRS